MPTHSLQWLFLCLLALIGAGIGVSAWAASSVVIDSTFDSANLGPSLRYIEDPKGELPFDSVRDLPENLWMQNNDDALKKGYTKSHYWIRVDIAGNTQIKPSSEYIIDMDLSFFGYLDLYLVSADGVEHHATGLARPYHQRPLPLETYALPLRLNPGEHKTLFIQAYSEGAMLVPLTLYSYDAFYQHRANTSMFLGCFFSLCLVLSAYNLFLYLTVREHSYLFYSINMLNMLWLQMSLRGFTVHYVWQDSFPAIVYLEPTVVVWMSLIFTLLFTSSFLKLRIWHPRLRVYFMGLIGISTVMTIVTLFIPLHISLTIFNVVSALDILSVIGAAVYTLIRGNKAARFFLMGWTFFLVSAFLTSVYLQGHLPTNLLTRHGMLIGGAFEGILLSLALADRINFMQKQKLQAQRNAVAALENAHHLKDDFLLSITRELNAPLDEIANAVARNREAPNTDVMQANNALVETQVHQVLDTVDRLLRQTESSAGLARNEPPTLAVTPTVTTTESRATDYPPLALIVEDNQVNQKVLQKMLERCGCRVQISQHGAEAVNFCENQTPDIVFMDCQMPVMDGFEATRQLRHRFNAQQLPIVAVTANVLSNDRLRCLESGMNDYLPKPVKIDQIKTALERWLPPGSAHAA